MFTKFLEDAITVDIKFESTDTFDSPFQPCFKIFQKASVTLKAF